MAKMTELEMLQALKDFDTPSITNVVATYPLNPPLSGALQSLDRELVYRPDDSLHVPRAWANRRLCGHLCLWIARPGFNRLTFMDVIDALDASPKPTILVLQQSSRPRLRARWVCRAPT